MEILAYLDAGSASALLAAILAGVAGIGAAFRSYGERISRILLFWKKEDPAADGPADKAAETDVPEPAKTDNS